MAPYILNIMKNGEISVGKAVLEVFTNNPDSTYRPIEIFHMIKKKIDIVDKDPLVVQHRIRSTLDGYKNLGIIEHVKPVGWKLIKK